MRGTDRSFGIVAASAYPYELNKRVIQAIVAKGRAALSHPGGLAAGVQRGVAIDAAAHRPMPLAGPLAPYPKAARKANNDSALGGVRSPHLAVARLPRPQAHR